MLNASNNRYFIADKMSYNQRKLFKHYKPYKSTNEKIFLK